MRRIGTSNIVRKIILSITPQYPAICIRTVKKISIGFFIFIAEY